MAARLFWYGRNYGVIDQYFLSFYLLKSCKKFYKVWILSSWTLSKMSPWGRSWCYMMTSSNGNISALLAICAGNSPASGEFLAQRPVTRSFDVFFDLRLDKRFSKQSWGWWFETLSRPLWRHCNEIWVVLVAHALNVIWIWQAIYHGTHSSRLSTLVHVLIWRPGKKWLVIAYHTIALKHHPKHNQCSCIYGKAFEINSVSIFI